MRTKTEVTKTEYSKINEYNHNRRVVMGEVVVSGYTDVYHNGSETRHEFTAITETKDYGPGKACETHINLINPGFGKEQYRAIKRAAASAARNNW